MERITSVSSQRHRMNGMDTQGHKVAVVKTGDMEHHLSYNNLGAEHHYGIHNPKTDDYSAHDSLSSAVHHLRSQGHIDLSDHHIKLHHLHEETVMDEAISAMVSAAHEQKPAEFAQSFATAMNERISARLDAMRPAVAAGIFGASKE